MSIVKDMSLAPSGRQKIQWVRDFMPALSGIEDRFRREKPFAGLTIAVSVHLEAKTANLGLVLREGGAEVYLTGCNPLSTQDDVAAAMAELGVETFGIHGVDMQGYEDLLAESLKCRPHLIVDDGGDLISLLSGKCAAYGDRLLGGCEETTTGIHRLYARERAGILPCPMMAVNDAKAKHYYDNKYGTGQSSWDGRRHGGQRHRHRGGPLQGSGGHHGELPGHAHGRGRKIWGHFCHRHRLQGRDRGAPLPGDEAQRHPVQLRPL